MERPTPSARRPFLTTWHRALDLGERLEALRLAERPKPRRTDLGARRLESWTSQKPFDTGDWFERRLAASGIGREELEAVLHHQDQDLADGAGEEPRWLAELEAAYGAEPPSVPRAVPREPFLLFAAPLIERAVARLEEYARRLAPPGAESPFDPEQAVALLRPALELDLLQIIFKTLVLELNVARLRGDLEGEKPDERFRDFVARLARPDVAHAILEEYPVLARKTVESAARWECFGAEFLGHLVEDREELESKLLGGRKLGRLAELSGGAGDSHRGGRSVQILAFDSGERLVYKPRSLEVDVHFHALLEWLNERGDHPPFRTLETLDRGTHGWVEFVETVGAESTEEIERFYQRQGGFLALLYLLEANDFHFENVLASGEHPVLVDLESLFQQRVFLYDVGKAAEQASSLIAFSVIRTGLLPQFAWGEDGAGQIDVSGLGAETGQTSGARRPLPDAVGTDSMRLESGTAEFEGGANRPTLNGAPVAALDWAPAIERGFESVYQTLMRHREELATADGPLAAFVGDEVRVILRHTKTYRAFLVDGLHPDLLRDALDRDQYFDRLWVGVEERNQIERLAHLEARELSDLDIPFFQSRPGSTSLFSATGTVIPDFFERTGLEIVREKLGSLDQEDLERQRWLIGACLTALDATPPVSEGRVLALDEVEPASAERLLAAARTVGDRLESLALRGADGGASWLGISATDDVHYMPVSLGPDLYSGLGGVALFLARLGSVTGQERYTELSRAAWRTLVDNLPTDAIPGPGELGTYTGVAGAVYASLQLAAAWQEPEPLESVEPVVRRIAEAVPEDGDLDVISGVAGAIPVLLAYAEATGDRAARAAAVRCGERLLETARPMATGVGWISRQAEERALSGFSHGAAGFAWALFELERATGDSRFGETARAAIEFERTLFDGEARNWRDLRSFLGPEGGFNVAWCNGAVGIGLARLAGWDLLREGERPAVLREIEDAVATTLAAGFSLNHSLCHGALGNLELLALAAEKLDREDCALRVAQAAAVISDEVEQGHFHCGVPGGFETPGLMDGLAGIGYGLLKLAAPRRVPSVLLLEAPPRAERSRLALAG